MSRAAGQLSEDFYHIWLSIKEASILRNRNSRNIGAKNFKEIISKYNLKKIR
jgi:hypothetical protein